MKREKLDVDSLDYFLGFTTDETVVSRQVSCVRHKRDTNPLRIGSNSGIRCFSLLRQSIEEEGSVKVYTNHRTRRRGSFGVFVKKYGRNTYTPQ